MVFFCCILGSAACRAAEFLDFCEAVLFFLMLLSARRRLALVVGSAASKAGCEQHFHSLLRSEARPVRLSFAAAFAAKRT